MLYEIWQGDCSTTFIPADSKDKHICLEPDDKLIGTIEAETWDKAMTKYHEFMKWDPYVPME